MTLTLLGFMFVSVQSSGDNSFIDAPKAFEVEGLQS